MTAHDAMAMTAALVSSLVCSCLGIVALAKCAINLLPTLRSEPFNTSSEDDDDDGDWIWPRDRFKIGAQFLALLATSAIFFGLSYALARWALAPVS